MPHILSASYDAMLLRTRQMVLESRGYEVTSAEGFDDALEKCKSGHYDLVIIGHSIPYDDKRSIARQLNFYCPAPILVLLTNGESPLPEAVECFEPSKPEQLLAAVERVLPPAKRAQAD